MAKENTSSCETDTWDQNGSEKTVTIYGNLYSFTYDDEDRLTKMVTPSATDTYTYNGLGLRVGKTDSTGTYSYVCDGTTPGSPVLADGHALYTPGLSENRGGTSIFYSFDRLGNLWTLDGTTKNQLGYIDFYSFGGAFAAAGSTSPFGYGGANGCQTDPDASLVLMGHRYYDPRTGRFISQDPAGSGDNWYAYAGNNPVNKIDPSGLITQQDADAGAKALTDGVPGLYDHWEVTNGDYEHAKYLYTTEVGFQSISIMGIHPPPYLNFPGNTGSQFLAQRFKYAKVEYQGHRLDVKARTKWLTSRVGKGCVWDLKKDVLKSEDPILWVSRDNAGNFMYGVIALGDGFHTQAVLFGGGYAQALDQGPLNALSNIFSHFDDPGGQAGIAAGIKWVNMGTPIYNVTSP